MNNIVLDYRLSEDWNNSKSDIDLNKVTKADLHYNLFLGDIIFKIKNCDFSAIWGWIPILDFAVGVYFALEELRNADSSIYEFTESNETIKFIKINENVKVIASYTEGLIEINYQEILLAERKFLRSFIIDISNKYPVLVNNKEFCEYKDLAFNS